MPFDWPVSNTQMDSFCQPENFSKRAGFEPATTGVRSILCNKYLKKYIVQNIYLFIYSWHPISIYELTLWSLPIWTNILIHNYRCVSRSTSLLKEVDVISLLCHSATRVIPLHIKLNCVFNFHVVIHACVTLQYKLQCYTLDSHVSYTVTCVTLSCVLHCPYGVTCTVIHMAV